MVSIILIPPYNARSDWWRAMVKFLYIVGCSDNNPMQSVMDETALFYCQILIIVKLHLRVFLLLKVFNIFHYWPLCDFDHI